MDDINIKALAPIFGISTGLPPEEIEERVLEKLIAMLDDESKNKALELGLDPFDFNSPDFDGLTALRAMNEEAEIALQGAAQAIRDAKNTLAKGAAKYGNHGQLEEKVVPLILPPPKR